jgi:hypothetical protein
MALLVQPREEATNGVVPRDRLNVVRGANQRPRAPPRRTPSLPGRCPLKRPGHHARLLPGPHGAATRPVREWTLASRESGEFRREHYRVEWSVSGCGVG